MLYTSIETISSFGFFSWQPVYLISYFIKSCNTPPPPPPPQIVFDFSWNIFKSQEKLQTISMEHSKSGGGGGGEGVNKMYYMGFEKIVINKPDTTIMDRTCRDHV